MKHKLRWASWISLLLLALAWLPAPVGQAQSEATQLANLMVELWPEYDRPEVLVIYQAELSPSTPLPAQLSFRLPGYIKTMHAVAIEQNGKLIDVNPDTIELRHQGDDLILSFPSPSARIQFEYYDPVILNRQDQTRQLAYEFLAPYNIEMTSFEVQEPFQAEDFLLTPAASDTFIGNNGLKYNLVKVAGLASGEIFAISATYKRSTTTVSAEALKDAAPAVEVVVDSEAPAGATNQTWGYVLLSLGLVLLLGVGAYWWWSERLKKEAASKKAARRPASPGVSRRPGQRRKQAIASKSQTRQKAPPSAKKPAGPPTAAPQTADFCYNCGVALRGDANFCHSCGAERR